MKSVIIIFFILVSGLQAVQAQDVLTLDQALALALKNNYDILLAKTGADIDKTNNTPGNAGMLPSVTLNATDNYSKIALDQKLSNGTVINRPDATSNILNSNVALSWTLFDGLRMFTTKKKLSEIEALGELQFRQQVIQTIFEVSVAYYNVVRQKQQLASLREVLSYNNERVKILQTSFNAGLTAKNNLLQAKIDLNVNTENALNQQTLIAAAIRSLNGLLNQPPEYVYEVSDSIQLSDLPDKEIMLQKMKSKNLDLLSLRQEQEIARQVIREMNGLRYPRLTLNGYYNYNQTNNSAGYQLFNKTVGPQIGGTFTVPLFQGGNNVRQSKVARLQYDAASYSLESATLELQVQLQNALAEYENQKQLLQIELDNDALAKENLDISLQRLKLGQTTQLEVKLAQESYTDSRTRLVNFLYFAKVAETKLKQLMAELE